MVIVLLTNGVAVAVSSALASTPFGVVTVTVTVIVPTGALGQRATATMVMAFSGVVGLRKGVKRRSQDEKVVAGVQVTVITRLTRVVGRPPRHFLSQRARHHVMPGTANGGQVSDSGM